MSPIILPDECTEMSYLDGEASGGMSEKTKDVLTWTGIGVGSLVGICCIGAGIHRVQTGRWFWQSPPKQTAQQLAQKAVDQERHYEDKVALAVEYQKTYGFNVHPRTIQIAPSTWIRHP